MNHVKEEVHYWCQETKSRRYLGQGITAAILDTGISAHPDFGRRTIAFRDFVNKRSVSYDDSEHGTHVAGILAGSGLLSGGVYSGMAPKTNLVIGKVLDHHGDGSIEDVLEGMEWILHMKEMYQIRIVNISVGTKPNVPKQAADQLIRMVERMWDAGLVVVASAGNYGPEEQSIAIPGICRKIITVGALKGGDILTSSSRGPTKECVVKPDILAPGSKIIACQGKWYGAKSGTSMATPVVSGAIALLLSKYPNMTNVEVKLILRESMEQKRKLNVERLLHTEL